MVGSFHALLFPEVRVSSLPQVEFSDEGVTGTSLLQFHRFYAPVDRPFPLVARARAVEMVGLFSVLSLNSFLARIYKYRACLYQYISVGFLSAMLSCFEVCFCFCCVFMVAPKIIKGRNQ